MTRATASKMLVALILLPIGIKGCQKWRHLRPPAGASPAAPVLPAAGAATPDHDLLDHLLRQYVGDDGVNYGGLKTEQKALQTYLKSLADVDPTRHGRDFLLALYINAYNAATLELVLEHYPGIQSIKDIPAEKRWDARRWRIAAETHSLNELEHAVLRGRFHEPRVHFAIVCASRGCPPLRNEAYRADRIDAQLDDQARRFHRQPRHFRYDAQDRAVSLSPIYQWFADDFRAGGKTLAGYAGQYATPPFDDVAGDTEIKVEFLDYDWSLNGS